MSDTSSCRSPEPVSPAWNRLRDLIGRGTTTRFRLIRGRCQASIGDLMADRRGATAIEFAMVGAPFLALMLGMLQVSILFFANQALETFTETAGRSILTGATQQNNYSQSQYKAALCAQLNSMFKCSNLYVDVTTVTTFSTANTQLPQLNFDANGNVTNTWQYNLGGNNSIVVLRLMYQWPVFGLPLGISLANQSNNSRLLMATAVFKNEQAN